MKSKKSLRSVYIFLSIFCAGWIIKLSVIAMKDNEAILNRKINSKYKNSFEEKVFQNAAKIREGINSIKKQALEKDSIAIFPNTKEYRDLMNREENQKEER